MNLYKKNLLFPFSCDYFSLGRLDGPNSERVLLPLYPFLAQSLASLLCCAVLQVKNNSRSFLFLIFLCFQFLPGCLLLSKSRKGGICDRPQTPWERQSRGYSSATNESARPVLPRLLIISLSLSPKRFNRFCFCFSSYMWPSSSTLFSRGLSIDPD